MNSEVEEIIQYLLDKKNTTGAWPLFSEADFAMQELAATVEGDFKKDIRVGHVMKTVGIMHDQGQTGQESFYKILTDVIATTKQDEDTEWKIFFPIQVELSDDLPTMPTLIIHGTKFAFCNINYLKSILPFDPTDRKERSNAGLSKLYKVKTMPQTYVVATVQGNSLNGVWNRLEPAFDLFKGFIEFQFSYGSQRFSSNKKPRAKLPHPEWFIAYDGEKTTSASTFIVTEHEVRKPIELTADSLSFLRDKSSFLQQIPSYNSIDSLIADALRLYSQAMDERFRSGCFLGLWQTLETIALSKEVNGDTNKICSRIAWQGKRVDLPGSGIKYRLRQLAKKRNNLVHRGMRDIFDNDVNTLKVIAEISIGWLQNRRNKLSTKKRLNTYYQFRTVSTLDIKEVQETLEYISDSR